MISHNHSAVPGIGIDFGTSNSAVAVRGDDGLARLLPLEGSATALPTALFFNAEDQRTYFGREAIGMYLAGADGRLMRSLKSLLGSALIEEQTVVAGTLVSFQDLIARFLAELRARAAKALGHAPTRVVLGRPVHFVDDDPARDAQAQAALEQAAAKAGFTRIAFQAEPIAAAFDYERRVAHESLVLVVDIGGGTSDFTVVRLRPGTATTIAGEPRDRADDVLATSGVHVGGTDFDRRLNLGQVMPLLGLGHRGPGGREVPSSVFHDLATWHLIHRLSGQRAMAQARGLRGSYADTRLHDRLMEVLEQRHGHAIASAVEQAKIDSSQSDVDSAIDLRFIEPGLHAVLQSPAMAAQLGPLLDQVVACARACCDAAGLAGRAPDALYLTGGSSALRPLQQALRVAFAGVPLVEGDRFGGVASGLAYAAA